MPGGFDFNGCKQKMMDSGKDEESANRICGWSEARSKNMASEIKLSEEEMKFAEEHLVVKEEAKKFAEDVQAEIFAVGTWNKDRYTSANIDELVSNFNILKDTVKPPAKLGHSEDQALLKKEGLPAAGWVTKLQRVGNKVMATFSDVPQVVKDLIEKKAYKRVSAEIYPKYKDPASGKIFNNVLRAVAFLGQDVPAVETLSDINLLYNKSPDGAIWYTMEVDDLNKQQVEGGIMSKWYVKLNGADTKETLVKKLSDALGNGVEVEVEDGTAADAATAAEEEKKRKEAEAAAAADAENKGIQEKKITEMVQQFEATKKLVGERETALAELQKKYDELTAQFAAKTTESTQLSQKLSEFEKTVKTDAIKGFTKQMIGEGKLLPKDEAVVVALMEQLDDKTVIKFTQEGKEESTGILEVVKKFISNLPKSVNFQEVAPHIEHKVYEGNVSIGGVNYEVQNLDLVQKAEKYAEDNKVDFVKALLEVSKEETK